MSEVNEGLCIVYRQGIRVRAVPFVMTVTRTLHLMRDEGRATYSYDHRAASFDMLLFIKEMERKMVNDNMAK